jgi:hypothetical protein
MQSMTPKQRDADSDPEVNADLVDVHILDMTAQIEALLRGVREMQRDILTLRGRIPQLGSRPERLAAASAVRRRLTGMLAECDELKTAVAEASDRATGLAALAERDERE